jgi:DNA polymerase/3'-5' exonuclease PolX
MYIQNIEQKEQMDPIVNESNRLLYQTFVSLAKRYAAIGEEYRSKALEKSGKVISLFPEEILSGKQIKHIPGIGKGTIRRINQFVTTGDVKIEDHEYMRAAQKVRVPVKDMPDVLVPRKRNHKYIFVAKNQYSLFNETENYYIFHSN